MLVFMRRWLTRASDDWMPRAVWSIQRTGRLGLSGLALLIASAVFLVSTYLPLASELDNLRGQVKSVSTRAAVENPTTAGDSGAALLRSLPQRGQMPALLGVLVQQAEAAHLSIDTGKYESTALKSGAVMSYKVSFPVTGPYPQVRRFIDATLVALPAAAVTELSITRKTIGDSAVEAQIRLTVFTRDTP
jgi:Tfp pilus assembly protein PilO